MGGRPKVKNERPMEKRGNRVYEYIRTAGHNKLSQGANMYVKCPVCQEFVLLMPGWGSCSCGGVDMQMDGLGRLVIAGTERGNLEIYRGMFIDRLTGEPIRDPNPEATKFMQEAARQAAGAMMKDMGIKSTAKSGSIWK